MGKRKRRKPTNEAAGESSLFINVNRELFFCPIFLLNPHNPHKEIK